MKSNRKQAVKVVWNWKEDYALELSGKDNSEIFALDKANDNLNTNIASERLLEQALMIRSELSRRHAQGEKLLEGVSF